MEEIERLVHRHPRKLTIGTLSGGNKGYEAKLAIVTYCRGLNNVDHKLKLRILLSFGYHGREIITSELALRILNILDEEYFLPNIDKRSLNSTLDKLHIVGANGKFEWTKTLGRRSL